MEQSQSQLDPAIAAEFHERKKRQWIAAVPAILVILLLVAAGEGGEVAGIPSSLIGAVGFPVIIAVVIFSLFNWRCPKCKKYLGKRISPRFCARCGVQLQE